MKEKQKGKVLGRIYIKTSKEGKRYFKGKLDGKPVFGVLCTDDKHLNKYTNEAEKYILISEDLNELNTSNQSESGQTNSESKEKGSKVIEQATKKNNVDLNDF